MNSENANSTNASETTSTPAPASPPPAPTAAEYLDQQQDLARAAMTRVLKEMQDALKDGANLAEWTRRYPWILTSSAVAAGFLTALMVTPAQDETFKQKYNQLREKLASQHRIEAEQAFQQAQTESPRSPSWLGSVLQQAVKMLAPMVTGLVTGAMAQQVSDGGNGHAHRASDNPEEYDH